MEEKTFKVTIEIEVTAENPKEALKFAVSDINEIHKENTLDAIIKKLD